MARSSPSGGGTDRIDCGGLVAQQRDGMTWGCWYNPSTFSSYGLIMGRYDGNAGSYSLLTRTDGKLATYNPLAAQTPIKDPCTATLSAGTWYHVLAVLQGTPVSKVFVYINGVLDSFSGDGPSSAAATNSSQFSFGLGSGGASAIGVTNGWADGAVWSVKLTAEEIYALGRGALRPYQIRPESLMAYWPLDGYRAGALDLGPYKRNGTLIGSPKLVPPPRFLRPTPILDVYGITQTPRRVVPAPEFELMGQIWM